MARELTPEELVKAPMYINRDVQFEMPRRSTRVDKNINAHAVVRVGIIRETISLNLLLLYTRVMMGISISVMIVWTYIYRS